VVRDACCVNLNPSKLKQHIRSGELAIKLDDSKQVTIRLASPGDAERIAVLCQQLGYPTAQEEARRRLHQIQQDEHHAVYVAELSNGHVVGWVHVYVSQLVITDSQAEIGGLVVDEGYRRCGIGQLLMQQAEQWARTKECRAVYLRSNIAREGAHVFYERIGYSNFRTQFAFRKVL
jgi:GNAT superfamily N-acetyltransferase